MQENDFLSLIAETNRVGLMGGTFDPIHFGHLVAAEYARQKFSLDKVVFIPSGQPPHKDYSVAGAEHRYLMTVMATATNPYFGVSRLEIDQDGPSYTIDTIMKIKVMLPHAKLFFISGADAVMDILKWKSPLKLVQSCHFIAATRPGYTFAELGNMLTSLGLPRNRHGDYISLMEIPSITTSSTDIRRRLQVGESIAYLVPENVEAYLHKYKLYEDN